MKRLVIRTVLITLVSACSPRSAPETIPGPALGESTASGPANPSAPNPDASEPTGVSSRLSPAAMGAATGAATPPQVASGQAAGAAVDSNAVDPTAATVPTGVGGAVPIAADGGVSPAPGPRDAGVGFGDAGPRPGLTDAGSAPVPGDAAPRPGLSDAGGPR
ncbi:MAG: hypothetical protein WKG01_14560 [Kofleriaceae bacterium]